MNTKVSTMVAVEKKDVSVLFSVFSDLKAVAPGYRFMCDLFNGFEKREFELLLTDYSYWIRSLDVAQCKLNLKMLKSFIKSLDLILGHFCVEHFESFGKIHSLISASRWQLQKLYDSLFNSNYEAN